MYMTLPISYNIAALLTRYTSYNLSFYAQSLLRQDLYEKELRNGNQVTCLKPKMDTLTQSYFY
jgi:hypothetical protein